MLSSSLACDRMLTQARQTAYVPWEEGLTLIYEDPTLPQEARFSQRLQRRVSASKETPQGRRVTITYSTLKSNNAFDFLNKDGSWVMMQGDTALLTMLPEGFPDRTDHWGSKTLGMTFRILGRATLETANMKLPDDFDRVGIWVEMTPRSGPKLRVFYLPGIGEAEDLVQKNGQWVMVNQLVSRGFTDAPVVTTEEKAP
jgi:hypothetical protein